MEWNRGQKDLDDSIAKKKKESKFLSICYDHVNSEGINY